MGIERLNFGTAGNNDGEVLRTAFLKLDANDADLDERVTTLETVGAPDLAAHIADPAGAHDASAISFTHPATGAVLRTVRAKASESLSVFDFGAVGDCTGVGVGTDDAAAIQDAFDWVGAGSFRELIFPAGYRFRVGSACTLDLGGSSPTFRRGQRVIMLSPITPDASAFDAFTIHNGWEGHLVLTAFEGGVDADYDQADPSGGSQAFVLRGLRGFTGGVRGRSLAGRLLRIPPQIGSEPKFSSTILEYIYYEASNTGQAYYIDSGQSAFGHIDKVWVYYGKYGPHFRDTQDISFGRFAQGTQNLGGATFKGCVSVHFGILDGADVTSPYVSTPILISDNPDTSKEAYNISIGQATIVPGLDGLVLRNIGAGGTYRTGCVIGNLTTLSNSGIGLTVDGCKNVSIANHDSRTEGKALKIMGASENIDINCGYAGVVGTAIEVAGTAENVVLRGFINEANTANTGSTSVVDVTTTGKVVFDDFSNKSTNGDYAYDLPSGNNVHFRGGEVAITGGGAKFSNPPKRFLDLDGYGSGRFNVHAQSSVAASHTGNTSETNLATVSVPAGAIGANGRLRITAQFSYPNSANNKILRVRFGGTAFHVVTVTTTTHTKFQIDIGNRNSASSQVAGVTGLNSGFGASTSAMATGTVNTGNAQNILLSVQLADGSETIVLESYDIELLYAA